MAKFEIILTQFGLGNIKAKAYSSALSSDLKPGGADVPVNLSSSPSDTVTKSLLGTLVFSDMLLKKTDGQYLYLTTVLFEVTQTKNIVTTTIAGRSGTIKEYISDGDYEVRIRGAIVSSNAESYPDEEVGELEQLLKLPQALEVVCDYLQIFGIYNIVVTGYSFPQSEGYQNTQFFEISAFSDIPVELIEEDV